MNRYMDRWMDRWWARNTITLPVARCLHYVCMRVWFAHNERTTNKARAYVGLTHTHIQYVQCMCTLCPHVYTSSTSKSDHVQIIHANLFSVTVDHIRMSAKAQLRTHSTHTHTRRPTTLRLYGCAFSSYMTVWVMLVRVSMSVSVWSRDAVAACCYLALAQQLRQPHNRVTMRTKRAMELHFRIEISILWILIHIVNASVCCWCMSGG